jgi:hypothetical protein
VTATPNDELRVPAATGPAVVPTAVPTAGAAAPADDATPRWLVGGGVLFVLAAGVAALLLRRRAARPPKNAEEAWSRVVGTLSGSGVTLPVAVTPRRATREAAAAWESRTGAELPWSVRDGISALARELEDERYAAPTDPDEDDRAERLDRLARLTREVTSGLAAAGRNAARQKVGAGR